MRQKNTRLRTIEIYSVLLTDLCIALISYFLAHFFKFGEFRFSYMPEMYTTFLLVIMLISVLYTIIIDPGRDFSSRGYLVEFASVTKYVITVFVAMSALLVMLKYAEDYSRLMFGYFCVLLEILTYAAHVLLKRYLRTYYKAEKNQTKLVVVTDSKNLEEVRTMINGRLDIMRGVAGYVVWDGKDADDETAGNLGNKDTYKEKVKLLAIDEVFIYLPGIERAQISDLISFFEAMGVVCDYAIDVADMYKSSAYVDTLAGYTVISYSINEVNYNKRMIKRLFDIMGSLIGIVITIVLIPFISIAIIVNDPGPIFFKQKRVGKNGRIFNMYKFRSMFKDAEARKNELMDDNNMEGPMFKMDNDPRVTGVGKFLRKTSLDEFPQFFNILKGDMSLVGTRPPTVDEYEQYDPHYKRRLSMKPGLTGMWQVSGRSDIQNFDEVVKLDLEYIDNWSMSMDMKILLKTIGAVLGRKGAK
ncbi:MAG: sugar transferase [Lachnospiraceae bacterium]|nr:sugar transferase [Lachnospiraceae bacterium]